MAKTSGKTGTTSRQDLESFLAELEMQPALRSSEAKPGRDSESAAAGKKKVLAALVSPAKEDTVAGEAGGMNRAGEGDVAQRSSSKASGLRASTASELMEQGHLKLASDDELLEEALEVTNVLLGLGHLGLEPRSPRRDRSRLSAEDMLDRSIFSAPSERTTRSKNVGVESDASMRVADLKHGTVGLHGTATRLGAMKFGTRPAPQTESLGRRAGGEDGVFASPPPPSPVNVKGYAEGAVTPRQGAYEEERQGASSNRNVAEFDAEEMCQVAGGALRKSSEKYDEMLVLSHHIEALFAPVNAELTAFLARYASLASFVRFSKRRKAEQRCLFFKERGGGEWGGGGVEREGGREIGVTMVP